LKRKKSSNQKIFMSHQKDNTAGNNRFDNRLANGSPDVSGYIMTLLIKLTLPSFLILLLSCKFNASNSIGKTTPLIPKDTTIKNERDNKLFVFVGEKINISHIPYTPGAFDSGVKAKYLILQRVYGYYDKDTIEFEAYDHYGRFAFADYKNVLLYVSEYEGKLYQEKYMYNPVFKTKDERWAGHILMIMGTLTINIQA
jgi:hypothetical protein